MFETGAVIAAEMRRVHHFDGEPVLLGQREEASGDLQHVLNETVFDPVAYEVEEAHASGRFPQVVQETRALRRRTVESTEVESGQGLGLNGDRHSSLLDSRRDRLSRPTTTACHHVQARESSMSIKLV
jgi:hypothetical protein